jgi:thiol-disulfide isomerase/thioredoxin
MLLFSLTLAAQHEIVFEIDNYDNDTIIIGNYFADRQVVVDTLYSAVDAKRPTFTLVGEEALPPGMYLIVTRPGGDYAQFFVPVDDQTFKVMLDGKNLSDVKFKGSDENKRFYDYLSYLSGKRAQVEPLSAKIKAAEEAGTNDDKAQSKLDKINAEVEQEQLRNIAANRTGPFAHLLQANMALDIPEFEGTAEEEQMSLYLWYRDHYFDNVDLGDSLNLRMPFLHQRIDYYYNNLTPLNPDSISRSIDYMLGLMEPSSSTYRYYLSYFYNDIVKKRVVGMDAVVVHLVEKYYANGKAPWLSKESYDKITDNAYRLKGTLIGKQAPDVELYREDGSPWQLYQDSSEWTVLVFWAPDCGHCTKAMPDVMAFHDKWKDRGVNVVGICTKTGKKYETCWPGVKEKGIENLLNLGDQYMKSKYKLKFDVRQTPKIYILDQDKYIRMKDVPASNLDEIMDEVIKMYKEESTE